MPKWTVRVKAIFEYEVEAKDEQSVREKVQDVDLGKNYVEDTFEIERIDEEIHMDDDEYIVVYGRPRRR